MTPQWYIPEPKLHHDSDNAHRLVYVLQEMGVEVFCDKYVPFGGMDYSFLDPKRPVVLYGHLGCVKDVQRRRIYLSPFAWCDFDELKCSNYYAFWGKYLVQQKYAFYPLDEIARNRDFIFDTFGAVQCLFIRPDDNMKTFTGEVVKKEQFEHWWRHCRDYESGPNCPCVVSRPELIYKEWRFVIREGKVVTGSQYKSEAGLDVKPGFPDLAAAKAEEIAGSTQWQPHPIYVMDIALTADLEYRLMECGSINVAGMYASDLRKMAQAVNELLEEEFVPPKD
jgi:hypothetical protein